MYLYKLGLFVYNSALKFRGSSCGLTVPCGLVFLACCYVGGHGGTACINIVAVMTDCPFVVFDILCTSKWTGVAKYVVQHQSLLS